MVLKMSFTLTWKLNVEALFILARGGALLSLEQDISVTLTALLDLGLEIWNLQHGRMNFWTRDETAGTAATLDQARGRQPGQGTISSGTRDGSGADRICRR